MFGSAVQIDHQSAIAFPSLAGRRHCSYSGDMQVKLLDLQAQYAPMREKSERRSMKFAIRNRSSRPPRRKF